jgi:3-hydroxyacyl-CoA dehydrogenase
MGRFGQKTGAGWYRYEAGARTPLVDDAVTALIVAESEKLGLTRRTVSDDEIRARCLFPLVNEGARILGEGIALRSSDVDVVWIHGYGFPAWRGGPMWWGDTVGAATVLRDVTRFGWTPAERLVRAAREGSRLSDES